MPEGDVAPLAAAAAVPVPADDLNDEEFARLWMMGLSAERTLGKPKDWDGKDEGFSSFTYKFANWLSALPGDAERLLELSTREPREISLATMNAKQRVVSRGIMQALRALVEGKALNIVKGVAESGNGFEAWHSNSIV